MAFSDCYFVGFYFGQLEDGHTLFDYNVGLNDIVQLLIRSDSDVPGTPLTNQDGKPSPRAVANCKNKVNLGANSGTSNLPSTSARSFLIDPGIGQYKVFMAFCNIGLLIQ